MVWENSFWNEVRKIQSQFDRLISGFSKDNDFFDFNSNYRKAFSSFNENDGEYVIEVEIPGVDKSDIKINFVNGGLEIKGIKKQEKKQEKDNGYYHSKSFIGYRRIIDLPSDADSERIDAEYRNGILKIKIPKKLKIKNKKEIKVR